MISRYGSGKGVSRSRVKERKRTVDYVDRGEGEENR